MPDIRLQDYTARIKGLISSNRHDEALAHCQHILRYYPKHVQTYALMGEICLEKEMYREAIEFFQRTLSADPENLIARVGLGIICDGQGAIPEAIWQLERAFELAPGNTEVRRELQRLYAQHEGGQKTRLKLTRGALGRLYSRNGLYERAIGEFQGILRQDPELPDIRVALVEALWREGRRLEAVEACLELLEALPNCLKANLILGDIWLRGGNEEAAMEKLNVARALDPENLVAQELMGPDSPLPPEEVLIPELEAMPEPFGLAGRETGAPVVAWRGVEEETAKAPAEATAPSGPEEELPAWLRDIGAVPEQEPAVEVAGEEAVAGAEPEEVLPMGEVPDWLQELMGEEIQPPVGEPGAIGEEVAAVEAPPVAEVPEWLEQLDEAEVPSPPVAEEAPSAEGLPGGAVIGGMAAAGVLLTAAVMGESEPEPVAAETEAVEPQEEPAEEVPEWLRALAVEETPPVVGAAILPPVEAPAEPAEEIPDWVRALEIPEAEEIAPATVAEVPGEEIPKAEIPASLLALVEAGILDEADLSVAMAEMSPEDLEAQRAEEVPAWLQELVGAEEAMIATQAMPVAEAEPVAEEPAPGEEEQALEEELIAAQAVPVAEAEPVVEEPAPGEEEQVPEEELPAWLQALAELGEEKEIAPIAELPIEPLPPVEAVVLPAIETPTAEVWAVEAVVPPIIETPVEEVRAVEETVPPAAEARPKGARCKGARRKEARREEVLAVEEEMPQVVTMPLKEAAVVEAELPAVVEVPAEETPVAVEEVPPVVEMLAEEVPVVEQKVLPVVAMPAEVVSEVEKEAPPVVEMPARELPGVEVAEQVAVPSRKDELLEQVNARPRDYKARVELAQAYSEERDWAAALTQYEKLVSARKFLPEVLHDLEQMLEEDVDRARLYQLMGDIYMHQDQLDKSLEAYRLARQALGRGRR